MDEQSILDSILNLISLCYTHNIAFNHTFNVSLMFEYIAQTCGHVCVLFSSSPAEKCDSTAV